MSSAPHSWADHCIGAFDQGLRAAESRLSDRRPIFVPNDGPQAMAYESAANVLGYGGAAGGGKTALLWGKALTRHRVSLLYRRNFKDHRETMQKMVGLLPPPHPGYNNQYHIARTSDGRRLELAYVEHERQLQGHRGSGKDLIAIDEAAEWPESFVRFLIGWNRSTIPGQACQTILTFNPPRSPQSPGVWVTKYFAAWLDKTHPNPAEYGELRWYARIDDEDAEVEGPEPFEHKGERVIPTSRTFVRALLGDNPYFGDEYRAVLQSMPEPYRSQLLYGDFGAGAEDDEWQVIPANWILEAQDRWAKTVGDDRGVVTHAGLDVARGGKDSSILAQRRGNRIDELLKIAGAKTPDETAAADWVLKNLESRRVVVQCDVVGASGGPVSGRLGALGTKVVALDGSKPSRRRSRNGIFGYFNLRAQWHWQLRELLDPENGHEIALPPDRDLLVDLCAPRYAVVRGRIKVEEKKEIKKRLGRSPDKGDAVIYAFADPMPAARRRHVWPD